MANFYLYRLQHVYSTVPGPNGPEGYWVIEFSGDGGTSWRPAFPFTFQSQTNAEQEALILISGENSFRDQVVSGQLGTLTDYVAVP